MARYKIVQHNPVTGGTTAGRTGQTPLTRRQAKAEVTASPGGGQPSVFGYTARAVRLPRRGRS